MAAVTICSDFGAQKIKSDTVSTVAPSVSHRWVPNDGTRCHDLSFLNAELSASFFTLLFQLHQEALLVPLHFLP